MWLALTHHRTHKNHRITFDGYQFMKKIYLDKSRDISIMKSTQCGVSELLIMRSWGRAYQGFSTFYVLPTFLLKGTFVKDRYERSIEYTKYYKTVGSVEKETIAMISSSASLKHIGSGSINFVGSNTTSAFTSYSADDVVIDELDECNSENIIMAPERQGNSKDPYTIRVANPTFEGMRIDEEYSKTDMQKWFIPCTSCGEWINPDFFKNVVRDEGDNDYSIRDEEWTWGCGRDVKIYCEHCNKPFDRKVDGQWVATGTGRTRGYHINKLFSGARPISYLLERFQEGLSNDTKLQRFYNGDLGIPFSSSGARIDYTLLDECTADYSMPESTKDVCVMGVDVGNWLHTIVGKITHDGRLQLLYIGRVKELSDLNELRKKYNVKCGVIDALPETRVSKKFTSLSRGFYRCFYGDTKKDALDPIKRVVTADRTTSLDETKELIVSKTIIIPRNSRTIEPLVADGKGKKISEFYAHMSASIRIFDEKKNKYFWTEGSKADHLHHALNYCVIARNLMKSI